MGKLTYNIMINFDLEKVKKVAIGQVKPNNYNPKEKKSEDYRKVLESIRVNGLMAPIFVRELKKDTYEVIDGEQRFTACEELGFEEILIYNYGTLKDEEAIQLTVWWQQQVPFDEIKLAEVFADLTNKVGGDWSKIKLPYTQEEIEEKIEMLKFDWTQYENNEVSIEKENKIDNMVNFECDEAVYEQIKALIESGKGNIRGTIKKGIKLYLNNENYKDFFEKIQELHKISQNDNEIYDNIIIQN